MSTNNTPKDRTIQLSLWDTPEQVVNTKPLPLRAAQEYGFPLQHYEPTEETPVYLYSVQDWIAGVAQTDNPRQFWRELKKRDVNSVFTTEKFPYRASDGKSYKMDYASDKTLYLITQAMGAKTGLSQRILKYLASAGAKFDELLINPDAAKAFTNELSDYHQLRSESIDTFKALMNRVYQICETPNPGELVNTEYIALMGKTAGQMRELLNTKNVRDALPSLQLSYVKTAEEGLKVLLTNQSRMSMPQIIAAAQKVCLPLGMHLQGICEMAGIDVVTGKPLLGE